MRRRVTLVASVATLCAFACAGTSRVFAAENGGASTNNASTNNSHGARWVVEVDGATCVKQRAVFEREIVLACDAMRTCRVTSRSEAELEAILRCDADGSWKLQTRTVEGTNLTSIDLTGASPEDRLREAAIEIARDAAPERTLVAETLGNTLSENDGDKLKLGPPELPRFSVSAGALAMTRTDEPGLVGGHALGGVRVGHRDTLTHVTLGLAGMGGGSGVSALRRFRAGIGIAFGAPFTTHAIGVTFEAGVDSTQNYVNNTSSRGDLVLTAVSKQHAYLQQNFVFQFPWKTVRPYIAFSIGVISSAPIITGGAETGVAIALF